MNASSFLTKCLALDLEARAGRIYSIGAVFGDRTFHRRGRFDPGRVALELDAFAEGAEAVLGHNLLDHDIPILRGLIPGLRLLDKPVIDTLYLSPLAFPENPYHRLVKDYKMVKNSVNDPVADAGLSASLFSDQWESFERLAQAGRLELLSFYRSCFKWAAAFGLSPYRGLAGVFEALGAPLITREKAADILQRNISDRVCRSALARIAPSALASFEERPALNYVLAWLRIAGSNSVLPPWVRHRFPSVATLLHALRDVPCADSGCTYCRIAHNAEEQLKRYFGFSQFRSHPSTEDGSSLQKAIVEHGMSERPLLAILPTGGGKSLCYQLPALVRHFRRGLLTIVISPLQALMKDQVDNLAAKTGTPYAAAINGLLTPPERGEVLERVRLGDTAILYVAPEQLRNRSFRKAIAQREIGCWVFDEAHCISKWGHDFRPDYLYAGRFIREFAEERKAPCPPVACFTATAKQDVKEEILDFFKRELGQELTLFEGSVERENLKFEVRTVSTAEKYAAIHTILTERLSDDAPGSALVYTATRRRAEEAADYLRMQGWQAGAFHAGLNAAEKRSIQEAFLRGELRVIAATNAFGMGIDKEDVRLVLHADIPGSLENYIQEAGRAGRDLQDAECVLLYDEQDVEVQFQLGALSKLGRKDIAEVLRVLRRSRRGPEGEVVITTGEVLRDEETEISFDSGDHQADTKVKTAVAWLERAGFLQRNENHTRVFQGKVLVKNMQEAEEKIGRMNLSPSRREQWLALLRAMMNAKPDEGLSADELAELRELREARNEADGGRPEQNGEKGETASQRVLRALHGMAEAGLIEEGIMLTAFVRHKVQSPPLQMFQRISSLEDDMLKVLREAAPDAAEDGWQNLSLRRLNQRLKDLGHDSNPEMLRNLLVSLSMDGKGLAGSKGSIQYRHVSQDQYRVKQLRDWDALTAVSKKRRTTAKVVLEAILSRIPADAPASAEHLTSFSTEDLVKAIRSHLFLSQEVKDPLAAVDRGLLYLHEQKVIILQQGLAVFRQAMSIKILPDSRKGRYLKGDYEPLEQHYRERIFQVHVVNEYARLGVERVRKALELVLAYFSMDRVSFIKRFFPGRREMLERATAQESFQRIVDHLANPVQMAVVAAPEYSNMLVLAGPGSGKTRVVVHRCAYLLRVLRVPPRSVLVLCFNHYAAVELRRRLCELVGNDAKGVTIQTYHGLAMRLTGTSFAELAERSRGEEFPFDDLIPEAIRLLRGDSDLPGLTPDEARDRLLAGFRHILVDEYQDIDSKQYDLVSAIAGRMERDPDSRLTIMAVGDDDQNIYTFRGANVELIRRFQQDYDARIHHLTENYRSTAHIIAAANALIRHNRDRMKVEYPIRINHGRERQHPGGRLGERDPLSEGRVQALDAANAEEQAAAIITECKRLKELDPDLQWSDIAVLARKRETLSPIRAACEHFGIPVAWALSRKKSPPLHRIREIAELLDGLKEQRKSILRASEVEKLLDTPEHAAQSDENPWCRLLRELLTSWREETSDAALPVSHTIEALYDALAERRREQRLGQGVFLGTIHGAKGMEFPHVFLCDGDWPTRKEKTEMEEERRTFYVGMTRARDSLTLFRRADAPNPHLPLIHGDFLLERKSPISPEPTLSVPLSLRYDTLGLGDVHLGFAGRYPESAPIHRHLSALTPGSLLSLRVSGSAAELLDADGHKVGMLSRKAAGEWADRIDLIKTVRILAMVRRERSDEAEEFQSSCRCPRWEVPWVEVIWEPPLPHHSSLHDKNYTKRAQCPRQV